MTPFPKGLRRAAWAIVVVTGLLPGALFWLFLGRVPTVSPNEAKEALSDRPHEAVLVDVRAAEEFAARHLEGARSWPFEKIAAAASPADVPEAIRGRRLFLICQSGILSGLAARRLRELGVTEVVHVQGGMQAWVGSAETPCAAGLCRLKLASGEAGELPFRESPLWEQVLAVVTGFVIKPLYTLLSSALIVVLWRQTSPDLAALRWAMIAFFVGENCCAANYLFRESSCLLEHLHSFGMALCFGLTTFAALEGADRRLVKLSDPEARCAALGLCRRCIKLTEAPCGLRRTFLLLIPAAMLLALMPLCAEMVTVSYNTRIFGSFFNYTQPVIHQIYEVRYCPVAALVLLGVSLLCLLFKKEEPVQWSKVFFAAGAGFLGFSFFRLTFVQLYRDNQVWFNTWEELTELIFVVSAGVVLWIFRHGLFARPAPEEASSG